MKPILSLLFGLLFSTALIGQQSQEQLRYIENFHQIAISEMIRSGIPASIKLAQGLLESDAGRSYLARKGNNHFGIKCGSNWNGREVFREDDDYNDRGELIKSCFRSYRNANASFVAHSEFLRDPRKAFRYGFLFRLDPQDYKRWAEGLRRAGYATNPNYPKLLISLIERYRLNQYDKVTSLDDPIASPVVRPGTQPSVPGPVTQPTTPSNPNPNSPVTNVPDNFFPEGIFNENDVTYFITGEALSIEEVARRVDINIRRLLEYNEAIKTDNQQVLPGQRVFLQKKRKSYRGRTTYHTVLATDNLQAISDRYGIRMESLLKRNKLTSPDQRVAPGEKIKLRGSKVANPPKLGGVPIPQPDQPTIPTNEDGNLDLDTSDPIIIDDTTPTTPPQPTTPNSRPPLPGNSNPDFGDGNTSDQEGNGTTPPAPQPPVVQPQPTTPSPQPPISQPAPQPPVSQPEPVTPSPQPPVTSPPANNAAQFHVVVKGDTLYSLSRRFNTTVDQLKQLNGLSSNTISIGQRLKVQ
ncbi:MAG: glucosaminidase domain-containing protein [Bacteroidota bacterium]